MSRLVRIVARGFCVSVVVLSAISSQALAAGGNPVALHLTFRKVARHVSSWPAGSGRYIAYATLGAPLPKGIRSWRLVLLDDLTGKRSQMTACGHPSAPPEWKLGGPWVAFDCGHIAKRWQLYNVQTHRWRRLTCGVDCRSEQDYATASAVGDRWMLVEITPPQWCGPSDPTHYECGPTTYLFYSIATGRMRTGLPSLGPNEFVDLNSKTLTSRTCDPVSAPAGSVYPPPVALDGPFAFVQSASGIYVQRCGSTQRTYLTTDPNKWSITPFAASFYENTRAAGFCTSQSTGNSLVGTLEGIYLPSLTQFTADVPEGGWCGATALGPRHVYIEGPPDATTLLAASFPPRPPRGAS